MVLTLRWVILLGVAFAVLQASGELTGRELGAVLLWVFCAMAAVGEMWNSGWGLGRLSFAWVVDLSFVPVAVLVAGGLGWGYLPKVALAVLSAALTAWALSASRRR